MAKQATAKRTTTKRAAAKRPGRAAPRSPKKAAPRARTTAIKQGRIEALTQVFAALGAQDPAAWARSHVDQGHDELGRFVLLRALWLKAVEPGRLLGIARNEPEVAAAAERLITVAGLADLDAVLRFAQKQALLDVCTVLDDPSASDEGIGWAVYRTDGRGLPLWPLDRLSAGLTDSEPR
ncbi:MAG: hypothetical protein IT383_20990 [Deltaproteobacteria bacterium]|nr:hypothetical protein [Deltaproteobacteria bacterium]